ncbi:hypothetical protein M0R45_014302 [Rubus argutus]|uniref:Uncharacterized protein n=1 Tax=Rubus argutus TaxID=59490 RepID=A0AAW1XLC7_RUBAR
MDRKDDNQSPQGETARILVEFLEVAITSIVFLKGITLQVLLREGNIEFGGLLPFIKKGLVERVAVIFFDSDNNPTERFMFKLTVVHSYGSKVKEADLEFSLRSFFVKLPVTESVTRILPPNCRWEITAYFRSLPRTSTKHPSLSEPRP